MNQKLLIRARRLRDPKNKRKREDQKALALAVADGKATLAELSHAVYGARTGNAIYVHVANGLLAHLRDQKN